ncbi:NnrS family protein [Thiogranum longum]
MEISSAASAPSGASWLRRGFRPFFLAAGGFAVLSVLVWFASYSLEWRFAFGGLAPVTWHAHEMVYGYSMAVVAGFLLTAVSNWSGMPTLRGVSLLLLFLFWLLARLFLLLAGGDFLFAAASFDVLFMAVLVAAISGPIVRAKLWLNLAIVGKILLLLASNLVFYFGAAGKLEQGVYWGLYSGLYLILALIFTLSRRVLPFFIERGVGYPVKLYNNKWIDVGSLLLFLGFWLAELVAPNGPVVALLASALFVLNLVRLLGWYTHGIWHKPLLWILYLAYAMLVVGFALKAAVFFIGLSPYIALHAFAVGGIGMMTLGMMTRVALGHTGRNVFEPPPVLFWIFSVLFVGVLVRVVIPMFDPSHYRLWIGVSQWLWIAAFAAFFVVYFPMLTRTRVDGRDG